MDNVYVSSWPQGSKFEGETYGTRTKPGETINSSSHRRDKQHMKSLKDEDSKVERVDSVGDPARKHQGGLACRNCGILHGKGFCPAAGQQCHKCKKLNHFARMCRMSGGQKKQVNTVDDYDSDTESMFIGAVNSGAQDWVETVDFGSVKEVFKLDTGA